MFMRLQSTLLMANILIWKNSERPEATLINGNLCLLIKPPAEPPYFLEPLGKDVSAGTVEICLKHSGKISRASEKFVSFLPKDRYAIAPLRNHFDYVYSVKELAELKGRKFDDD